MSEESYFPADYLINIYDDVTVVLLLGGISFILKRKRERGAVEKNGISTCSWII
jgi:hypothetical protein